MRYCQNDFGGDLHHEADTATEFFYRGIRETDMGRLH